MRKSTSAMVFSFALHCMYTAHHPSGVQGRRTAERYGPGSHGDRGNQKHKFRASEIYSIINKGCPYSTGVPFSTRMRETTPERSATI